MIEPFAIMNPGRRADVAGGEDFGLTLQEQGVGVLIDIEYIGTVKTLVDIITVSLKLSD